MNSDKLIENGLGLVEGVELAAESGYSYVPCAVSQQACDRLVAEADSLELALEERVVNPGTEREINYKYEQGYAALGDVSMPFASFFGRELAKRVMLRRYRPGFEPLSSWLPSGLGYQRYRDASHHLGPHRDSASERLLRATVTLEGVATVKIYETHDDENNYNDVDQIDEFEADQGGIMFLRAAGLGSGKRTIHEVLPPTSGSRLILNLRMVDAEQ